MYPRSSKYFNPFLLQRIPTSDKIEVFEVDDEFYDRYIVGEKPEGVKSLGIFDCEVEPLTPEQLMETFEKESQFSSTNNQVLSPQSQGWMLTAQQLQDELTQTQAELKESNEQLQQTQDELEELKIQQSQTQAELEQSQTQLQTQLTESAELRKSNEQLHQTQDELEKLKIQQSQTQAELEQDREQLHQTQAQSEHYQIQLHQIQEQLEHSKIQLQQKTVELDKLNSQQHHTRLAQIIKERSQL